jgi:CubicO group peptidase (beta-lactamase class C family)
LYDAAMQVPLDAWQIGPWNRWAYVNVGEVVATVPVPRGDLLELERADGGLDDLLQPLFDTAYADGVAVVRGGRLVAERYGGEMTETSLHLSQSVGKSVLGLLVGILGIDTERLVTELVPEVAASGYEGATVQHLLDMTAAIDFVEDYDAFVRYDYACGWAPEVPGSPGTILGFLPTIGSAAWEHGERFHYATPNTDLLGLVAERAGGASLAELIPGRNGSHRRRLLRDVARLRPPRRAGRRRRPRHRPGRLDRPARARGPRRMGASHGSRHRR